MRLGILGGSFNPPHVGHLLLASYAQSQLHLDKVVLVPAWSPPHKEIDDRVPAEVRLDLARAAIGDDDRLAVSDVEARLRLRFTIDSLYALRDEYPGAELWFLAGADSLLAFTTWRDPRGILEVSRLAVAPRSGCTADEVESARERLAEYGDPARVVPIDMPLVDISSSALRERVRAGLSIRYAVPAAVEAAVAALRLYELAAQQHEPASANGAEAGAGEPGRSGGGPAGLTFAEARRLMAERVGADLYGHCERVGRYAAGLAARWDAPPEEAELAGLLHDFWRKADAETVLKRCTELGEPISELEMRRPVQLLHARLAAAELLRMGVAPRVCAAIARHTVGGAGMTRLEKCVYVADAAEPARSYDGVDELRALAQTSLDAAVAWSNRRGLAQLLAKGRPIHLDSVALYNEDL